MARQVFRAERSGRRIGGLCGNSVPENGVTASWNSREYFIRHTASVEATIKEGMP
ncbi:hypothetical protein [Lysobacter sp. CA199]|uniref:hypothetical protein n=1 Tax=Lysobacter sp. CA199 TaxID=3455608 RepID=UPI003F8D30EA